MTETDRDALTRAFEDPAQRRRVDQWLAAGRSWEEVARSCACDLQSQALGLKPWQLPPTSATIADHLDDVLREPFGPSGRREAGEILKKLLALGLSRYEPNPMQAIQQAEQRRAVK